MLTFALSKSFLIYSLNIYISKEKVICCWVELDDVGRAELLEKPAVAALAAPTRAQREI